MITQTQFISFAEILRNRRITRGFTQRDVAKMMHCTQSQISDYENGITQPTLPLFIEWAGVLGFHVTLENIK